MSPAIAPELPRCGALSSGAGSWHPLAHALRVLLGQLAPPADEVQSIFWLMRVYLRLETGRFGSTVHG